MKYTLTTSQFNSLWNNIEKPIEDTEKTLRQNRIKYWDKHFRKKYHLIYSESETEYNPNHDAFVLGIDSRINWFLMQL